MCGRYQLNVMDPEVSAILEEIQREQGGLPIKTGEIFPTDRAPVWHMAHSAVVPRAMVWGFPRWDGKGVVFNARTETALSKAMFRKALLEHPVVVPTTGFYEWKAEPGHRKKDKYLFREADTGILFLAGFSNSFRDKDGMPVECFTILTTEANPSMAAYHDRMPLLLRTAERDAWLHGEDRDYFLRRQPFALEAVAVTA